MYRKSQFTLQLQVYLILLSCIVISQCWVVGHLYENDPCKNNYIVGKCLPQSRCTTLEAYVAAGELRKADVTTCSFALHEEIICCPLETFRSTNILNEPVPEPNRNAQEKHKIVKNALNISTLHRGEKKADGSTGKSNASNTANYEENIKKLFTSVPLFSLFPATYIDTDGTRAISHRSDVTFGGTDTKSKANSNVRGNISRNIVGNSRGYDKDNNKNNYNGRTVYGSYQNFEPSGNNRYDKSWPNSHGRSAGHGNVKIHTSYNSDNTARQPLRPPKKSLAPTAATYHESFNIESDYATDSVAGNFLPLAKLFTTNVDNQQVYNRNEDDHVNKDFVMESSTSKIQRDVGGIFKTDNEFLTIIRNDTNVPSANTETVIFKTDKDFLDLCCTDAPTTTTKTTKTTTKTTKTTTAVTQYFPHAHPEMNSGDLCSTSRYAGVCMAASTCLTAEQLIRNKTLTQDDVISCGLGIFEEIICCPNEHAIEPRAPWDTTIVLTTSRPTITTTPSTTTTSTPTKLIKPSLIERYPHMVALGYMSENLQEIEFRCAGFLIASRFVVITTNCLLHAVPSVVRLGANDVVGDYEDEDKLPEHARRVFTVEVKRPHTMRGDISILELRESVNISSHIRPAVPCQRDYSMAQTKHAKFSVVGWSQLESELITCPLQETTLKNTELSECQEAYEYYSISVPQRRDDYLDTHMCCESLFEEPAPDAAPCSEPCLVGAGAVLHLWLDDSVYCVAGIATPISICDDESPALFTKITESMNFIKSIVWPNAQDNV